MPPPNDGWLKRDKEFIELLIFYEENNAFGKNYAKSNLSWKEIANRVNMPAAYCRKKWLSIKYNYAKLKNMIKVGRVTKDRVQNNPKTAKYFDGTLDALDRFISDDEKLPVSVHRFFASSFDEEAGTHSVDAKKLTKEKQRLKDNPEITSEPECTLSNAEQAMDEEYRTVNNSNDLAVVIPMRQLTLPSRPVQQEYHIDDIVDVPSSSKKPRKRRGPKPAAQDCNLARFLVKYTTLSIENEESCDLKVYMADLAEVLCSRLTPEKRKYFLSEIDLIVSDMLEG